MPSRDFGGKHRLDPFYEKPGRYLNLGCGDDVKPVARGWTNLDAYYEHPDVVKHDMLGVPWPFADSTFDAIHASHVVEHIPTVFRPHKDGLRDVLFDVMEEMHRVLKPGGRLHVLTPWGGSNMGMAHPQHYRQWRPEWFGNFHPEGEENYYSTARFRVLSWRRNRFGLRHPHVLRFGKSDLGLFHHLAIRVPPLRPLLMERGELEAWLECVK